MQVAPNTNFVEPQAPRNTANEERQNAPAGAETGRTPEASTPLKRVEPSVKTEAAPQDLKGSRIVANENNVVNANIERANSYQRDGQNAPPEVVGSAVDKVA